MRFLIISFGLVGLWAASLSAQTLTPAQKTTLKANIQANGDTNTLCLNGDLSGLAALYNAQASPDFWVWRTSVSKDEYLGSTSVDATVFAWTGTGYITRSQGERDAFNALFNAEGFVNPSRANVRTAFTDVFSGATAPAPANRTHMATTSRRRVTRFERVFVTGTGSTAVPGLLGIEAATFALGVLTGTLPFETFIGPPFQPCN